MPSGAAQPLPVDSAPSPT